MTNLTAALLCKMLDAGSTVADIADAAGVSPSRVYQAMRSLGRSASAVRSERTGLRPTVLCSGELAGYAITRDGNVLSCVAPRTGAQTPHWRRLTIQRGPQGRLYVQLGSSSGVRRRMSPLTIYRNAYCSGGSAGGEDRAQKLWASVRRRLNVD